MEEVEANMYTLYYWCYMTGSYREYQGCVDDFYDLPTALARAGEEEIRTGRQFAVMDPAGNLHDWKQR